MGWIKGSVLKIAAAAARLLPVTVKRWLYRSPLIANFLRRSLNRAAPSGITSVEVAGGILAGTHLHLDLQTEKDYWLGTYEFNLQESAKKFITEGMRVFDVGANIGYISLMAARLAGSAGRVFAFEALPANIKRLKDNLTANRWASMVNVVWAAVTDKVGEIDFLVHPSGAMGKAAGSAGREGEYSQRVQVPAISLDHFVFQEGHPPPQLIKLDIEGGEGLALLGMRRILEQARPTLLIELHGEQAARQVWDTLNAHGYTLHRMGGEYEQITDVERMEWKAYLVALPEEWDGQLIK